jgi:hypothetical protein
LLATLPSDLAAQTRAQRGQRQPREALQALLLKLCECQPFAAEELETLLDKHRKYLMTEHIRPLVLAGKLRLRYPESAKHPHQAYVAAGAINPAIEYLLAVRPELVEGRSQSRASTSSARTVASESKGQVNKDKNSD